MRLEATTDEAEEEGDEVEVEGEEEEEDAVELVSALGMEVVVAGAACWVV